jgi:hypothetical protein
MDTKSPRCSPPSNGQPHPLFIEGGPKLAVTLKSCENRDFTDCPPHRNRTVRHSKPTARTAIIMCQSRPLGPRADCPRPWGGLSAVQNFEPTNLQMSLTKSGSDRRTVRSPWADCPQIILDTQDRTTKILRPFQLLRAGRPPPWIGRSAVHFGPLTEPKMALLEFIRDNGGPSAPMGGPSAGLFPAEMYLGKTAITLSSDVQIR